ncbi:hypothetical protein DEO72_LG8g1485 [Vigna unguiculata]|uniref:Uncharacterized protein n=1 Tax=Vigna unguiculata TaxID=3917 RepID=A0A4D6MS43_VIGUN|nr:hypothetical protein DEO72_LG8g1485 [Vigna unguiculata]
MKGFLTQRSGPSWLKGELNCYVESVMNLRESWKIGIGRNWLNLIIITMNSLFESSIPMPTFINILTRTGSRGSEERRWVMIDRHHKEKKPILCITLKIFNDFVAWLGDNPFFPRETTRVANQGFENMHEDADATRVPNEAAEIVEEAGTKEEPIDVEEEVEQEAEEDKVFFDVNSQLEDPTNQTPPKPNSF